MSDTNDGGTMRQEDVDIRSALLLNARFRVSPSATMRDKTIDRIVEQCLCVNLDNGLTLDGLVRKGKISAETRLLHRDDVRASIFRLEKKGRIKSESRHGELYYYPSCDVIKECQQFREEDGKRFNVVAGELFADVNGNVEAYRTAFFNALCRIFSRLTSAYVVISTKSAATSDKHLSTLITQACHNVLSKHQDIDGNVFKKALFRFFDDRTPTFDALKWIMAQNYYSMRLLGIDPTAHQLAAEMLRGATLYLDTNILIVVMMPEHSSYADISDVLKCCEAISVRLVVSDITMREFISSVNSNAELLGEVYKYIPPKTRQRVHSFILEEYIAVARKEKGLTLEDFLTKFKDPIAALRQKLKSVTLEPPDEWFTDECETPGTKELDVLVADKFAEMRPYRKTPSASLHDALMLRWIEKCQTNTNERCLFLTRDQTLVAADKVSACTRIRTVALDTLLQWIAPYCSSDEQIDHLAGIYAAALRSQLLPQEQIFKLQDFEIFRAMEVETAALPAEAVEDCLIKIKGLFPSMDIRKSEDRERIAYEISKHFVDPVSVAATKIRELNQTVADTDVARNAAEVRLRESEEQRISEKAAKEGREVENQGLRAELDRLRKERGDSRRSVAFGIAILVFVASCSVLCVLVNKYAEGANLFQKLTEAWAWFVISPALSFYAFRVYLHGSWSAAFGKTADSD